MDSSFKSIILGTLPLTTSGSAVLISGTAVVVSSDSRLTDARTPLTHTHVIGDVTGLTAALATKYDSGSAIPASQLTGTIDVARLPVIPGANNVISSGGIAALTSPQQATIDMGTVVTTTDGRRWIYTGSGTKTLEASYIEMADVTPEWTVIANVPAALTNIAGNISSTVTATNVTFQVAALTATGTVTANTFAGSGASLTGLTKSQVGLANVENTALSTWTGTSTLTTVGTIGTGTWQGTLVAGQYGGTGVNNSGKTITLGGSLTTSGAFTTTLTVTGNTTLTLPTTGTLLTTTGDGSGLTGLTKTQIGLGNVENTALSTWAGSANVTTLGTIATGTWQGGLVAGQYGGTGVNNSGKTITLGGNFATSGAFATTLTVTGATNVTLPTSGTLLTTTGNGSGLTGLTKTQVGLANVENTALSTWAGSANITTLGAVTSGSIATTGTISSAYDKFGTGSPEGAVTAAIGTIYHRTDGGTNTTIYRKESGAGNTGWVATSSAATFDPASPGAIGGTTPAAITGTTITANTGFVGSGASLTGLTKAQVGLSNVENTALSTWAGTSNLTTLGTVTTGTWNASLIAGQYGGTGVNNTGKTITLGGNLTTSGAFATTLTVTAATNVTLPISGTLLTTTGDGSGLTGLTKTQVGLSNVENTALSTWAGTANITTLGTIGTGTWNGSLVAGQYGGTGVNNSGKTITLGGNLTTSGAFATTLTVTGTTTVTLPTSGTLLTTTGDGSGLTGLTKTQVGLANVENTALSTWAGSANITTLGTVTSGSIATTGTISSAYDKFGTGSPEGAVTAPVGTIYHRTDGGTNTTIYRKETGSGNTGWVATAAGAATYAGLDVRPVKYFADTTAPSASVADFAGQLIVYPSGAFAFAYGTGAGNITLAEPTCLNPIVHFYGLQLSGNISAVEATFTGQTTLLGTAINVLNGELIFSRNNPGFNILSLQNTTGTQGSVSAMTFRDSDGKEKGAIGWGPRGTGTIAFPFTDAVYLESSQVFSVTGPNLAKDIVIEQAHLTAGQVVEFNEKARFADGGRTTFWKNGIWGSQVPAIDIATGGNVGIGDVGTTTALLRVGTGTVNTAIGLTWGAYFGQNSSTLARIGIDGAAGSGLEFLEGGARQWAVTSSGSVLSFYNVPGSATYFSIDAATNSVNAAGFIYGIGLNPYTSYVGDVGGIRPWNLIHGSSLQADGQFVGPGRLNIDSTVGIHLLGVSGGGYIDNSLELSNATGGFSAIVFDRTLYVARLTFTGQPSNGQTVTVGGKTYTFQTTLTNVDGNVKIGAALTDSITNLAHAISVGSAGSGTGSGTLYAAATTQGQANAKWETSTRLQAWGRSNLDATLTVTTATTVTGATWSGNLTYNEHEVGGAAAIGLNRKSYPTAISSGSDYHGLYIATNSTYWDVANGVNAALGEAETITLTQHKGPIGNQHRRIFIDSPMYGGNYTITAYGFTDAVGSEDVREGPIGWHLLKDGRMGVGTKTLVAGAQLTVAGAISSTSKMVGTGAPVKYFASGGALTAGTADFDGQLGSTADGAFSYMHTVYGTHPGVSFLNDILYVKEIQSSVGISSSPLVVTGFLTNPSTGGSINMTSKSGEHIIATGGTTYIDNTLKVFNLSYSVLAANIATVSSINTSTDVVTTTAAHGLVVGDAVSFSTTGTLPGGLIAVSGSPSISLGMYVRSVPSGTTFTLSLSKTDILLDLTSAGTGTHTLSKVQTGHAAMCLYADNDVNPGSFTIGLNRLGSTEFANTVFMSTNSVDGSPLAPRSILIAQQQGTLQEVHARLLFDGPNHTISMWGWDTTNVNTRGNPAFFVAEDGRVALGTLSATTGTRVTIAGGTTSLSPLNINSGTNKTTAVAGDVEYDGVNFYLSNEANNRATICAEQMFHLTAAGSTIGTTIANYFGTTSNITLVSGAYYVIDVELFFLKTTASTVTFTFTNSAAPTGMNIYSEFSPLTGISATGVSDLSAHIYNSTTAAQTLVTGSLTTAVNHYAYFRIILKNGTGTSLKIQATCASGTITPGIGSYWKCRRIPAGNVGTFAA